MAGRDETGIGLDSSELQLVLRTAHEAFVSIDEAGIVRAWNPAAEHVFGRPAEEALGRPLRDLIIPERYREAHDAGLRRFRATGAGPLIDRRFEITGLHADGREIPVEMTISAVGGPRGWVFYAFLRDITERHEAEHARGMLATLVADSADAIITRDRESRVTSWNPAAERLYGYSEEEALGRTLDRLEPPDRAGEARRIFARALAGEAVVGFETQRLRKDGTLVDVSITASPVRDVSGEVTLISLVARDIGARKRAERALARANDDLRRLNELKSHFVAVTSHELRTPLTAIGGFARTLTARWQELSDADKAAFASIIDEQAQRLTRLVEDLLTLSRIEAGGPARPAGPVDVGATVRAVVAGQGWEGVEIHAEGPATAHVHADDLHRMLVNLVGNALVHGAPPVGVSVAARDGVVDVRVDDGGTGVDESFRPHLFDPFTQSEASRDQGRGSGLGLAIVRALAESAGGRVAYEPRPGGGASFALTLPAGPAPGAASGFDRAAVEE